MGVLLRLGDPELPEAVGGEDLAQVVHHLPLGEDHREVEVLVVDAHACEKDPGGLQPVELVEARLGQCIGELPCPVRPEVPKYDGVSALDSGDWVIPLAHKHDGLHVVVSGVAPPVGVVDGDEGVCLSVALAQGQEVVCLPGPLPVGVPIHGVVAAHDRGYPADALLADLL